jgi:hypothetical protein
MGPAIRPAGDRATSRRRARAAASAAVCALAAAVLVAACSSSTPASGSAATPVSSAAATPARPAPSPTSWPGNVPDAVIALGALDEQMAAAAKAMDDAVTAEDFAALSGAAKGLVDLMDGSAENVKTVQEYPGTKDVGDTYASAMADIRAGAQAIVDGVAKGDAAAINAGVADLSSGITEYGLARRALGPLVEQAISMKRMYVK